MTRLFLSPFNRARGLLVGVTFLLFLLNAVGLTDLRVMLGGNFAIHPQVVSDLVGGNLTAPLTQPDFLTFVLVGTVLALGLPHLAPIGASMLTLVAMLPPFYVAWAYPLPAAVIPLEYSLLAILILFAINVLSSYFIETHERAQIVAAFSQYVPPPVVEQISRNPDAFSMAGEARNMTVLFSDIQRFSTISEQLEPAALAAMLNVYLTAMTEVLHAHGATIDKYIGDAIMAFWGAPLRQDDHAARAVAAALGMSERLAALQPAFIARGWPPLKAGIGIASGPMSVGNMGSRSRIAYTVIGDAVNLAARLEALTRLYGEDILISASTCAGNPDVDLREIDHVRVRGKGQASRIYTPSPRTRPNPALRSRQDAALAAYYAGDWETAQHHLEGVLELDPQSRWATVLHERVTRHPCPPQWDGVVGFHSELAYSIGSAETPAAPST